MIDVAVELSVAEDARIARLAAMQMQMQIQDRKHTAYGHYGICKSALISHAHAQCFCPAHARVRAREFNAAMPCAQSTRTLAYAHVRVL